MQHTTLSLQFDGETTVTDIPIGMLMGTGPWAVNDLCSPPSSIMRARYMNTDQTGVGFGSFNLIWHTPQRE